MGLSGVFHGANTVESELSVILYLALFVGGAGAGFINAVAGGGSALILPILLYAGMDAHVANGTNRVAVALQSGTATWSFHRSGVRPWVDCWRDALFILMGALLGALIAVDISPETQERFFGVIFVILAVLVLIAPGWLTPDPGAAPSNPLLRAVLFFAIGLYGGAFQVGVGIPLLFGFVNLAKLDVAHANAAKVIVVLVYSLVVLTVFSSSGQVDWICGGVLGLGGILGSIIGAKAVIGRGLGLVRVVLVVSLILGSIRSLI